MSAEKVSQIVKGKTTRAEVEALLGPPEMVNMIADGRRMMSYTYNQTDMSVNPVTAILGPLATASGSIRMQSLQIYLSKEGIVDDYEFSDSTRDVSGGAFGTQSTRR